MCEKENERASKRYKSYNNTVANKLPNVTARRALTYVRPKLRPKCGSISASHALDTGNAERRKLSLMAKCTDLHVFLCWVTVPSRKFKCAGDTSVNALNDPFSRSRHLLFCCFIDRRNTESFSMIIVCLEDKDGYYGPGFTPILVDKNIPQKNSNLNSSISHCFSVAQIYRINIQA